MGAVSVAIQAFAAARDAGVRLLSRACLLSLTTSMRCAEVIMKVISQEDTLKGLEAMSEEAEQKMVSLTQEKTDWEKKVEEIKYAANGSAGSRTVVTGYETQLGAANGRCTSWKRKYHEHHDRFIRAMSGVEHLCDKLSEVKIDTPAIPLSEDTVVDVLAQCEQKLKMLIKGGLTLRDLIGAGGADDGRPGSAVREHNVRVKIEDHEMGDDLPLENDDEAVDDEVSAAATHAFHSRAENPFFVSSSAAPRIDLSL